MWFDKWVEHLKSLNVEFFWEAKLNTIVFDGEKIQGALLSSREKVEADIYVLAINPFFLADIIDRTSAIAKLH